MSLNTRPPYVQLPADTYKALFDENKKLKSEVEFLKASIEAWTRPFQDGWKDDIDWHYDSEEENLLGENL